MGSVAVCESRRCCLSYPRPCLPHPQSRGYRRSAEAARAGVGRMVDGKCGQLSHPQESRLHGAVRSRDELRAQCGHLDLLSCGPGDVVRCAQPIASYKFCLSFENSLATDYVTEKFFDPILVGTVPVYRGAPNIQQFAPGEHAFINANEFSGPSDLAIYLKELDRDAVAYRRYFLWRERPFLPSFEADLARRGDPFAKLVEIMRRRLSW